MNLVLRGTPCAIAGIVVALAASGARTAPDQQPPKASARSQSFDRDPGWEGRNNRQLPRELPTVTQDFGYSETSFAGKARGEMGGRVTRASEPAYYAVRTGPKTLDEPLSASGSFALTKSGGNSGVFFGFFRAEQARARFPSTTRFSVDLPEGYRRQHTTFDHFGLMNMMKPGGPMTIYFDDLTVDGRRQDFTQDSGWDASRNRLTYRATDVPGAQNFGFSDTQHAGGKPGEIGGAFWRSENAWGYYADRVGLLSLDDRLEARGRVTLAAGGPDSDMAFGWFGNAEGGESPFRAGSFLGIKVGGPTRVGHYFLPAFTASEQVRALPDTGPVLEPGRTYPWALRYEPSAANGQGAITATLGEETVTHILRAGQKAAAKGAVLDHFGMLSIPPGGQIVRLYLDDLQYTARSQ